MAEKSGFFNAIINDNGIDRKYNAEDYSDNLAVVISSGVLRSSADDLKVTSNGLTLNTNAGRAWIKGRYYNNSTPLALTVPAPPTSGSRKDRVVLRLDNSITSRAIKVKYLTGTAASSPTAPALTRTDTIYDLCLAEIAVGANASSVTVTDTRADATLCGWVYSVSGDGSFFTSLDNSFNTWFEEKKDTLASVTLFKRYKWEIDKSGIFSQLTFLIPQYDADTCFLEVYVNGMLSNGYTVNGWTISFFPYLENAHVTVFCYKSIDGTGIMSVSDEITELQNEVAALAGAGHYVYNATGTDDNISISEIVQAIQTGTFDDSTATTAAVNFITALGGLQWLQSLDADAQITIDVCGKLGVTTPVYGSGTTSSRYRYFNLSQVSHTDKRVMLDFSKADTIYLTPNDSKSYIVFYGTDLYIKGASVYAINTGSACNVQMVAGSNYGVIEVDACRFTIDTTGNAIIATNGTFTNCECELRSSDGDAYCFAPTTNYLVRIFGGTFRAYIKDSSKISAVFYIASGETNATILATNVNCPSKTLDGVTGYIQENLANSNSGKCVIQNVTSPLQSLGGSLNVISNQISVSKVW